MIADGLAGRTVALATCGSAEDGPTKGIGLTARATAVIAFVFTSGPSGAWGTSTLSAAVALTRRVGGVGQAPIYAVCGVVAPEGRHGTVVKAAAGRTADRAGPTPAPTRMTPQLFGTNEWVTKVACPQLKEVPRKPELPLLP